MQQQEMANLVERQRINANRRPMKLRVPSQSELSPHNSSHEVNFPAHFERQVTASTEGLSDITLESDDGVGSDRTTTACESQLIPVYDANVMQTLLSSLM